MKPEARVSRYKSFIKVGSRLLVLAGGVRKVWTLELLEKLEPSHARTDL